MVSRVGSSRWEATASMFCASCSLAPRLGGGGTRKETTSGMIQVCQSPAVGSRPDGVPAVADRPQNRMNWVDVNNILFMCTSRGDDTMAGEVIPAGIKSPRGASYDYRPQNAMVGPTKRRIIGG